MDRTPGLSVRLELTLSYAGFAMLAGALLLTAAWVFLLRGYPAHRLIHRLSDFPRAFNPMNFGPSVFGAAVVVVLLCLLVFGLVGGWFAGRMLAPLDRITDATRVATTGSLGHRIRLPGRGDEFRELADAFDAMLARLEAQVAEQQRFAANASHELRTPLAITQTLLEVARSDGHRGDDEPRRPPPLGQHPSHPPHRSTAAAQPRRPTVVHFRTRRPVPYRRRSDRDAPSLRRTTRCRPRDLRRHGEKLTPHLVATLAEPFQRGADRVRTHHAGFGLGLAIVKSITRAHDGALTLTPRADGGLRVLVQLHHTLDGATQGRGREDFKSAEG